ncbi:hypothetical protein OCU04_005769 [Sclerotinia nivalis]|uniref:phosphoethanolamine N-methyltransferase n=1 Tax=Sclerotinia nivalis TaxID=352851 RepID=A0A9X0DIR1_9HELO|nr:hypothetical protein OCU04_005769 [Sclerotinia nivalis]
MKMSSVDSIGADDISAFKFYDSISDKYDKYYGLDPGLLTFIKESLELLPPNASVLDIGSGTGIPTSLSVIQSGRKLHGIDFSPKMIALSQKNVPGATFECISMLDYEPKEKFDAAFVIFSMFHFQRGEMEKVVGKWRGWVKEGGWIFVGTILAEDAGMVEDSMFDEERLCAENVPGKFMGHVYGNLLYTRKGWERLLGDNGFEIVKTRKEAFQAQAEAECDEEVHFWIMARRVGEEKEG